MTCQRPRHLGTRAGVPLRWVASLPLCALFLVASVHPAQGAGVVGTGTPGSCTEAALDAALAGGGLITFDCGRDPVTVTISSTKTIDADAVIDGGSLITVSGGDRVGVFVVNTGVNCTVQNLTIAHGRGRSTGGGIANFGTLTVTNSTFFGNGSGRSTLGPGAGGGILNFGTLTVTNSTFSDNRADYGGGIDNIGTLTVNNSTFSGNRTLFGGGSIFNGGMTTLTNTIVANSSSGANCGGTHITDGGHNLDDGTSCGFSAANGSLSNTDPQLDPAGLQSNGGPTQTVALCTAVGVPAGCTSASPAIDAGDQAVCAAEPVNNLDQRVFVRPGAGHVNCSIGAYEVDAIKSEATRTPTVTATRAFTTTPTQTPVTNACTGDCNANGMVAINELVLGVSIVLGTQSLDGCPQFADPQGVVDIAQLIKGVNNALNGCAG